MGGSRRAKAEDMGLLFFLRLFLIALLSGGAQHTHAWGTEGHYMVCKIAQVVQFAFPPQKKGKLSTILFFQRTMRK